MDGSGDGNRWRALRGARQHTNQQTKGTHMNIGAAFPGSYIKAADLQGRSVTVMISHVAMEEIGGDHKPVLYMHGKERGLVLNKTNASIIAEMHGWETDDWQAKPITLYPARVEFQGRIVDAVRVKLEPQNAQRAAVNAPAANGSHPRPAQPPPQAAQPVPTVTVDDDIPF
jgi:hypothetical protein